MSTNIKVTKRDGKKESLNLDKFHKMVSWTVEGLSGCSASEIELAARPNFYDGIKTSDVHKSTIKATANLISLRTPNYQYAAARSLLMEVRKEVWGQFEPKPLLETVKNDMKLGFYEDFMEYYTEDEINYYGSKIRYERDLNFTYIGLNTLMDKYASKIKDERFLETPQEIFMLVPMAAFKRDKRRILEFYDDLSLFKKSLPSPIMSGLRTKRKSYASCCLIDAGDTTTSLIAANGACSLMTTKAAGIGIFNGSVRGIGSLVKNGSIIHNGIVSILQWHESAVKWASQGARGGSATSFHMFWDWEIEKILTLKSNKSTPENSVKKLDYGIGFNKLFFDRVDKNEDITLFSAEESRDLINNLNDYDLWEKTYITLENKRGIRKNKISARELLEKFAKERFETGRYYPIFLDHINNGPLKDVIKMSNLCLEILLPTKPMTDLYGNDGEVALCILSNVNAGRIKSIDEIPRITENLVYFLDGIIDIQEYPIPAAENPTVNARYLGIGTSDWAHYLTKRKTRYDTQEALDLAEEFAEHMQFHLLKASCKLAQEKGEAKWFREKSKYADGWLPNDGKWRFIPKEDWESLRKDIIKYGLRNLTLSAIPPAGTSSDVSNSTSGIDMPRDLIITKKSKTGNAKQIVPNFSKGSSYYTLAPELDNIKYLEMLSKFQLYTDQSLSANVYWTPEKDFELDPNSGKMKFPNKKMIKTIKRAWKLGLKTTYYSTFIDAMNIDEEPEEGCEGGGCKV